MKSDVARYSARDRSIRKNLRRFAGSAAWLATICRSTIGRAATVVAVSGSYGKTTTTRAVIAALGLREHKLQTLGYNAFASLYLQLAAYTAFRKKAVVEVGIGLPGQMRNYARVIRPDVTVITGVGAAHIGNFPAGIVSIAKEKQQLVRELPIGGLAVLNADDARVAAMAKQTRARTITFGFAPEADVLIRSCQSSDLRGSRINMVFRGVDYQVNSRLLGTAAAFAIAPALAIGIELGRAAPDVIAALEALESTPGRMQALHLDSGGVLLLDEFKGTPATAHHAFDEIAALPAVRRIAVLGHIPASTPEPHTDVYFQLGVHAGRILDRAYLIHHSDENFAAYCRGLIEGGLPAAQIRRVASIVAAHSELSRELSAGDIVLLKGHNFDRLSRVALLLQGADVRCNITYCPRVGPIRCPDCALLAQAANTEFDSTAPGPRYQGAE